MVRRTWIAIPVVAAGVLLTLTAGAQDARDTQAELAEMLLAEDTTRGQMAESMLRALEVADFQPPDCVPGEETFDDVPAGSPFCPWIEDLARRGITVGCGDDRYCPHDPHSRQQMAVFLVRGIEAAIADVPEGPPGPEGPEGPVGPEGPPGPPGFAGDCNAGLAPDDEMVRVGSVCIDKYEASIWTERDGGMQLTTEAEIDALCPDNGQDCKDMIFARSVADVEPASDITWFQAQQALANSGKRLPTNAEWQMAVAGTPDPGGSPGSEDCNTFSSAAEMTGERENCVSDWGAHDMVGNLWEWVADWDELAFTCDVWPTTFGDDQTCVGRGDGDPTNRFPGALVRGGNFADSTGAGPFAVFGRNQPSFSSSSFGFRGAR